MRDHVCILVWVQFYFKHRKMQNILEYITHNYCQGKEICLLFEELPGDRLWQPHRTLQFAMGSTSLDPTSLCGKSVCYRCLQFIAKEPETWGRRNHLRCSNWYVMGLVLRSCDFSCLSTDLLQPSSGGGWRH